MVVRNSISNTILVFDEVLGTILNEDMKRKSMGFRSRMNLTIENIGRQKERGKSQ